MMKKRGEQEVKTTDTSDKKEKIERQLQAPAFGAMLMKLLTDPVLNTYLATMLGRKQQGQSSQQSIKRGSPNQELLFGDGTGMRYGCMQSRLFGKVDYEAAAITTTKKT